jgi:predicted anti-sigma-YlaC factor YlaD
MSDRHDLDALLATDTTDDVDAGCAAGFEVLHRYVESQLAGGDPALELPGLDAHLRRCPACQEDYLGLLSVARDFGDADPRAT